MQSVAPTENTNAAAPMAFARSKTRSFDTAHKIGGLQFRLKAKMAQKEEQNSPNKTNV